MLRMRPALTQVTHSVPEPAPPQPRSPPALLARLALARFSARWQRRLAGSTLPPALRPLAAAPAFHYNPLTAAHRPFLYVGGPALHQPPARVLLVTSQPALRATMAQALAQAGLQLLDAQPVQQADLVLLDGALPASDAIAACAQAHQAGLAVLLLANTTSDAARGLDAGADEYVTLPCSPEELALRVRLALHHATAARPPIAVGALWLDPARHQATFAGRPLALTATEFRLLACLAANAGRVVPWQTLLKQAWLVEGSQGGREMVKTGIYRLRRKLGPGASARLILTVRSTGYLLADGE